MQPRYYQDEAATAVWNYLHANPHGFNPLVGMPTGSGKALVINMIAKRFMFTYPQTRILMATHVKELVAQNEASLKRYWPAAPVGINSASLKRRDTHLPIVFGGVQSMVNQISALGERHLMFVDEAHLMPPKKEAQYQRLIAGLQAKFPYLRVVGLTATPYRSNGILHGAGKLFTEMCYDITGVDAFNKLVYEGYLAPLIPRPTETYLDYSDVGDVAGDFNQGELEKALDKEKITRQALKECIELGHDRKSWLVFASGVNHAEHITDMLNTLGISAVCVHGNLDAKVRDLRIQAYKDGHVRAIVNFNVLTTGFDDPKTDMIVMLRPTKSPGLWVQMLGRGTRPCFGKLDCLVLDFARNTLNLGPINDPVIPKNKKGKKSTSTVAVPIKTCTIHNTIRSPFTQKANGCGALNHIQARFCVDCKNEFLQKVKIESEASTLALVKTSDDPVVQDQPIIKRYTVSNAFYAPHTGNSMRPCLKSSYMVKESMKHVIEYIHLEASGEIGFKARQWWTERHSTPPPETVSMAVQYISQLRAPRFIEVWENHPSGYPQIMRHEY